MNNEININKIIEILKKEAINWDVPIVTLIAIQEKDPFKILISTILSLRTKDEITIKASKKLYQILNKPEDIYNLTSKEIEIAIYPVGFYKRKSLQIIEICKELYEKYNSKVPKDIPTLLTFNGVGRKTANLVLSEGYNIPAICVDTHVHRISNRFGFLKTKNPEETEMELRQKLNKKYWIIYNTLLVSFGQKICRPVSPYCSKCKISKYCKKINVKKSR